MKVLVVGGTGLIGQALTRLLVDAGHSVWVLTRNPQAAQLPAGVQAAGWDGRSAEGWKDLASEVDALVNLAGENLGARPWTNERKERLRASRVNVGRAIVEALAGSAHRPRVLLQSSAVGYYGVHGDELLTEKSPHGNDYLSSVAVDWETSTEPVEGMGVRRVVTRSGVVLSREGGALPRMVYPFQLFAGGPLGSGRQWLSWIHITDEVNAMRFLLEREDASGVYNLTAPEPVTNAEFGKTLAQVIGRPYWLPAPAFALKALLGEMGTMVLDGQRVLSQKLLDLGFSFVFDRLKPALEDLFKREPEKR